MRAPIDAVTTRNTRFARFSVIFLLPLALALAACNRQASSEQLMNEAKRFQDTGDYKSAAIQLKNALQNDASNPEIRYRLGVVYNRTGDGLSAEKELKKALELDPKHPKVAAELGAAFLRQGAFERVLTDIKAPEAGAANRAEVLVLRAQAHAALRQMKEAEESFALALETRPGFINALVGQARLKASAQDWDGALAILDQALRTDSKNLDALIAKGDFKRFQGRIDDAIVAYSAAVEGNPQSIPARLSRAAALLASGKNTEAQADIDATFKIQPNNLIGTYLQALVHYRRGQNEASRDSLQEVLKALPNHQPSLLLSGAVYSALGSKEQAETNLRKVLDIAPDNLIAGRLLTALLLRAKQPQKAVEVIETLVVRGVDDPQVLALAGDAYMQTGDYEKATQYFEKAATIDPKSANIRTGLGLSRLAGGEASAAMADLEKAATMDSDQFKADILLTMSHLNRREFDAALTALASLEKKQPNNPLTYNFKGAAFVGKKDFANARKNFDRALELNPTYFPASANLAQLELKDNKPQAAKQRFLAVLEKDKSNLQAMLALASLATLTKQPNEALEWIRKARLANPKAPQSSLALVRHYMQVGDMKLAVAAAQDAHNQNPDNPQLLDLLGTAQLSAKQNSEAITTFEKLSKLQPDSPLAHYRTAQAELAAKNERAAEASLRKALALKPDFLDAQVALAGLHVQAKRFDEALAVANTTIKSTPKSPAGHVLAGDIFMAQDKAEQAAIAYQAAFDLAKSGTILIKLHNAENAAGKNVSTAVIEKHLSDNPQDLQVRVYLADLMMKKNLYLEASKHYQFILTRDPKNLLALNNIAWSLQQLKDPRAMKFAEEAYALQPSDPAIEDTLAMLLLDAGKTARAVELLQAAADKAPDSPEINYHLAQALEKSGARDKAKSLLERILASGKKFPEESEARALLAQLKK